MIIKKRNYPCIGHVRAKQLRGKERRWQLSIYPPADTGGLAGTAGASHVELTVETAEVERIARVAPHLIPDISNEPRPERFGLSIGGRSKVADPRTENRPDPSPSMQTANSEQKLTPNDR